jgi:hypothetical protein
VRTHLVLFKLFDNHRPPSSFITWQIYNCHPVTDEVRLDR